MIEIIKDLENLIYTDFNELLSAGMTAAMVISFALFIYAVKRE